jgi:CRP/FNR family transcriptional regulator
MLYRVRAGDSCVLTTSCLLAHEPYPATAVTETEVTALTLNERAFQQALDASAQFRRFVFTNLSSRLAEVIRRMEEVAFGDIDQRLAAALLTRQAAGTLGNTTHQALATELGTAREVVSRHLKRFEERRWVRLNRGAIELIDTAALAQLRAVATE